MVISHDVDFIAAVADRIIVLDGGALPSTRQELLTRGGLYEAIRSSGCGCPHRRRSKFGRGGWPRLDNGRRGAVTSGSSAPAAH